MDILFAILFIFWPFVWVYLFFVKGYARIKYPGSGNGNYLYTQEHLAKEKEKGWNWAVVSLAAILLWVIAPPLIFGF